MTAKTLIRTPASCPLRKGSADLWLWTWGFPAGDYQRHAEHVIRGSELLRETLSSNPWYAKKAAATVARGEDEMAYWQDLFVGQINTLVPLGRSSTQRREILPVL